MLTTSVEQLEGNHVKLTVTVPGPEVDEAVKEAYSEVGAKVRVPGFRKGKAPRPVVDNFMGRDYVLAQATEALVERAYSDAVDAEGLRPIESPEIDEIETVVPGEEFTFTATIEVRPELTLSELGDLTVTVPPRFVSDAQIDEQIEIARDRFASLEPVEGRALGENDFGLISFTGYVEGEPYEGNVVDKYLYELGSGQLPAEFDAGLIGMIPGDEKRIEFTLAQTSTNPEYAGKNAQFDVVVHEVKAKVLPEVDDEFASNVGGFDTVEEMRQDLRARMGASQQLQHERAKEEGLKAKLAESLVGDVPESMVRQKTQQMMRDFESTMKQQGMTVQQYVDGLGMPLEALEADINRQALQAVREDLALEALFRAEGLEVRDEDVTAEIESMVSDGQTAESMRQRWEQAGLMPIIREQIIRQRAVEWLTDHGTIIESDGSSTGDTETEE